MTTHAQTAATVAEIQAELAALEDPKIRAVNERHGDEHGVNLTKLRAIATRLKTQHELALELWATGDAATRLVALLVSPSHRVRVKVLGMIGFVEERGIDCDDALVDELAVVLRSVGQTQGAAHVHRDVAELAGVEC